MSKANSFFLDIKRFIQFSSLVEDFVLHHLMVVSKREIKVDIFFCCPIYKISLITLFLISIFSVFFFCIRSKLIFFLLYICIYITIDGTEKLLLKGKDCLVKQLFLFPFFFFLNIYLYKY